MSRNPRPGSLLVLCFGLLAGGILGGPLAAEEPAPGANTPEPKLTERQKRIKELFKASSVKFDKDLVVLEYSFESKDHSLTEDWTPALNPNVQRIRWSRGLEGTYSSVEDGIIVGDYGEWYHRAVFTNNVEVEVDLLPVSPYKSGNLMCAVLYNDKKKRSIGSNEGNQVVCLAGRKLAKAPVPKTEKAISANTRHKMGFALKGSVVEGRLNGKRSVDSSEQPKFAEGIDSGRVGLVWSGSIQYFIYKVTVRGKLDPAWLAKEIGPGFDDEKAETAEAGNKKGSTKSSSSSAKKSGKKGKEPEESGKKPDPKESRSPAGTRP